MSETKPEFTSAQTQIPQQRGVRTSLRTKMTLWSGLILALAAAILITFSATTLRQTALTDAQKEAQAIAETYAQQIRAELDVPLLTARTMANSLEAIKDPVRPITMTRDQVNAILQRVAIENPTFLATYTLWEPNAFDGQDAKYVNAEGHDATGRFIPYWVRRADGSVTVEPLKDYEVPGTGDWYLQPRATKQEFTIAPYLYDIQGVETVMATFVAPVVVNGMFYGIAGVDAPIAYTQGIVDRVNLYNGRAEMSLLTDAGTLIAVHLKPELANQPATQVFPDFEQLQPRLAAGEVFVSLSPDEQFLRVFSPIDIGQVGTHWAIGLEVPFAEITAAATAAVISQVGISIGIIVLALIVLWVLTGRVVLPIRELTTAARRAAQGDLTVVAKSASADETGVLADAFNTMTGRLRELIGSLEQRVADRTKALATSTEVSRRLSTILNRKELVAEVVNQVTTAFGYYHTQIYFFDETKENLVMAGGTGHAGETLLARAHHIARGRGLVGQAADTGRAVLVSDTAQNAEWLPNPLLPDTKAEAAVPIAIGDEVLGVLDVQHNLTNGLQQADVDSLQAVANQIAVALQNIRQYENSQKIAADMGVVANVGIATSTITEVGRLLQEVVDLSKQSFNLYHAHIYLLDEAGDTLELTAGAGEVGRQMVAEKRTIPLDREQSLVARAARTREGVVVNDVTLAPDFLPNPLLPDTRSEMAVPMIVANQVLGVLDVQSDMVNRFTEVDVSIQTTLAAQVGVALQNAQSYSQSRRLAERETRINLITQKIQDTTSIEAALQIAARELGHALGMKPTLVTLDASLAEVQGQ